MYDYLHWPDLHSVQGELNDIACLMRKQCIDVREPLFNLSKAALINALEELVVSKLSDGDKSAVILMVAGHGIPDPVQWHKDRSKVKDGYFVAYDAPSWPFTDTNIAASPGRSIIVGIPNQPKSQDEMRRWADLKSQHLVSFSEIKSKLIDLDPYPARHRLLLVDTCFSGLAAKSTRGGGIAQVPQPTEDIGIYAKRVSEHEVTEVITAGAENLEVPAASAFAGALKKFFRGEGGPPWTKRWVSAAALHSFIADEVTITHQDEPLAHYVLRETSNPSSAFLLRNPRAVPDRRIVDARPESGPIPEVKRALSIAPIDLPLRSSDKVKVTISGVAAERDVLFSDASRRYIPLEIKSNTFSAEELVDGKPGRARYHIRSPDGTNLVEQEISWVVDDQAPSIAVDGRVAGIFCNSGSATLTGRVTDANLPARILVNSTEVTLGQDGAFSLALDRLPGADKLDIKAVDRAQNETRIEVPLLADRGPPVVGLSVVGDATKFKRAFESLLVNFSVSDENMLDWYITSPGPISFSGATEGHANADTSVQVKFDSDEGDAPIKLTARDRCGLTQTVEKTVFWNTQRPLMSSKAEKSVIRVFATDRSYAKLESAEIRLNGERLTARDESDRDGKYEFLVKPKCGRNRVSFAVTDNRSIVTEKEWGFDCECKYLCQQECGNSVGFFQFYEIEFVPDRDRAAEGGFCHTNGMTCNPGIISRAEVTKCKKE